MHMKVSRQKTVHSQVPCLSAEPMAEAGEQILERTDRQLTSSVLAVQKLAVCAFSPLSGLIQRPVKSLGFSLLTSISFESSLAFSLPTWLFSYLLASV